MGSPKAAKSRASHGGIWRRKISAPFAVIVVAAVLVLVAFTGQFAHGPDGQSLGSLKSKRGLSSFFSVCSVLTGDFLSASSRFTPVHVDDGTLRRVPTDQGKRIEFMLFQSSFRLLVSCSSLPCEC